MYAFVKKQQELETVKNSNNPFNLCYRANICKDCGRFGHGRPSRKCGGPDIKSRRMGSFWTTSQLR